MENASYTTLTRQVGLLREMQAIANNIANTATTGFRQETVGFSEYVQRVEGEPSLSMALANYDFSSTLQGAMTKTGGQFDFAIEGEGYFLVQSPQGERLTRAGSFAPNAQGDLVTKDGYPVLDPGGAPIFVPPDASDLSVSADGTLSSNGRPLAQLGVVQPVEGSELLREGGVMFRVEGGFEPSGSSRVVQGFLENSNVDAVGQIARMIAVKRAYEMGQSFAEAEHERTRTALKTLLK
ncbi:flagellar hook-basal body complex protein [Primorskyibacter aestuariivivens]|uniref:flagellar hook-basal body complex protein n=1 Tax=Primorskyibacter aestuariivivens TaxID=1888912 RepID=UPI0023008F46|nr:flagellar hook-basal body complex protein [Primorskyibacter aestuariivivens]MDA7430199.1 flagellar hook-basal body complex protein [Primorskyibacter aestuariivivens]